MPLDIAKSRISFFCCLHWPRRHVNTLVKEVETGRERERYRRREERLQVKGPNLSCWLPTNMEVSCAVLEETEGGKRRRRWRRGGGKQGKYEGGWTARRIPRVNYPCEGGTVANTLHLICKAAAKVHLSSASECPAIAPRQLMSSFNDMCFSVWQWLASCGLGQLAKREGLSNASCLPTETNFR